MFATLFVMGMPALFPAQAGSGGGCACGGIRPGGPAGGKRLFAAPLQRVREALEDAMQAGGVLLLESTSGVVRGERVRRGDQMPYPMVRSRGVRSRVSPDVYVVDTPAPADHDGLLPARWFSAVYVDAGRNVVRLAR